MKVIDNSVDAILNKKYKGKTITVYLLEYQYLDKSPPRFEWSIPNKPHISQEWSLDLVTWDKKQSATSETTKKLLKKKRVKCKEVIFEFDYEGIEYYAVVEGIEGVDKIKFSLY